MYFAIVHDSTGKIFSVCAGFVVRKTLDCIYENGFSSSDFSVYPVEVFHCGLIPRNPNETEFKLSRDLNINENFIQRVQPYQVQKLTDICNSFNKFRFKYEKKIS